ncbi:MAG: hypothetical protein ACYC8V_13015 [Caulobacteraceae bacterium]
MTTPSDAMAGTPFQAGGGGASAPLSPTRPFAWSVRRELWEHPSILVVPLIVAGVQLFGFLVGTFDLPRAHRAFLALTPARQSAEVALPYDIAAAALILTSLIVGAFYCLGALNGERRDRTILFWKSLPVSDLTTVLAKASIPLLVLPVVTFAIIFAAQLATLLINSVALLVIGFSPAILWLRVPLAPMSVAVLYGLTTLSLWYAPIWGWLLLVSGWARRATFLWAVGAPLGLCLFEKIAFGSANLFSVLIHRLSGGFDEAFDLGPNDSFGGDLSQLDPMKFLTSPGLWTGLIVATAFLAAAVWQRRRREAI